MKNKTNAGAASAKRDAARAKYDAACAAKNNARAKHDAECDARLATLAAARDARFVVVGAFIAFWLAVAALVALVAFQKP